MKLYVCLCPRTKLIITDRMHNFYRTSAKPVERKMRGDAIPRERSSKGEFAIQWIPTPLSCLTNDDSFLLLSSDKWTENQNNKQGRDNSSVERRGWRSRELFKEFNRLITNDEEEERFILQVVNQAGQLELVLFSHNKGVCSWCSPCNIPAVYRV